LARRTNGDFSRENPVVLARLARLHGETHNKGNRGAIMEDHASGHLHTFKCVD